MHGELTSYLTWPIVVLALIGLVLGLWRGPRLTVLLAIWAGGEIASAISARDEPACALRRAGGAVRAQLAAIGADELVRIVQNVPATGALSPPLAPS